MKGVDWMPFFGDSFWASERVAAMDDSAALLYSWLIWRQFQHGDLPPVEALRRLPHRWQGKAFDRLWPQISGCFEVGADGRLSNARCGAIRADSLAKHEKARLRAVRGNEVRWWGKSPKDPSAIPQGSGKDRSDSDIDSDREEKRGAAQAPPPTPEPKKRPRKPSTGDQADAIRHWEAEWERTRLGQRYAVQTKDGVAFAKLVKLGDLAEINARATRLLESQQDFHVRAASPGLLLAQWNQLAVDVQPRAVEPKGFQAIRDRRRASGAEPLQEALALLKGRHTKEATP